MADHETPGDKLSRRLVARSGLSRVTMEDGGEVHKGPIARRALRAVGARAMTMDRSIVVDDDFDPSDPEDQALYAHERVHQLESGGDDQPNQMHDAEEVAARAVERMVLHRRASGEGFDSIMRDVRDPVTRGEQARAPSQQGHSGPTGSGGNTTQNAYNLLLAQGKNHDQIVDMFARKVIEVLVEREHQSLLRSVPVKSI